MFSPLKTAASYTSCPQLRVAGGLEPISKVRYNLDKPILFHKTDAEKQTSRLTPMYNLESPIHQTCMLLDCGRKPNYLERTHAGLGGTCQPRTGRDPSRNQTYHLLAVRCKKGQFVHRAKMIALQSLQNLLYNSNNNKHNSEGQNVDYGGEQQLTSPCG